MGDTYNSKDIQVLEGLDAVRVRPGMYIGSTGIKGLHHLLWEIVDNGIDEITNGYGDTIDVVLYKDGSVSVKDNGRGVPVDPHPTLKVSGVEVVFTQLHAGGKFGQGNYNYSGGLHGVGASVTNALSEWLHVIVDKDGKKYEMHFASVVENGKIKRGKPMDSLTCIGKAEGHGTFVRFKPDPRVFKDVTFSFETIVKRLKELAFLNKGITITITDERNTNLLGEPFKEEFKFEGGLKDFCLYLNEGKNVLYNNPVYIEGKSDVLELSFSMQHTDAYTETICSYVNNIPTTEGGYHEFGLKTAITKCLNDLARKNGVLKDKDPNMMGEDFREGVTAVLAVKMHEVQFEGQTKTKLGNPEAKTEVENIVTAELNNYFSLKENATVLDEILKKAKNAAMAREAAKRAKEITRQQRSIDSSSLVGKLAAATGKKPELNELFIVEGNSAGGTAKQARDRSTQAILPLRGKPLNAEKKRLPQVLANEEIRTIISALGTGIGQDFNLDNLKYHKVIILSDADQDGAHIRAILLTFFFRYMRELITNGHVYIGLPPLYRIYKKDYSEYVYSDAELKEALDRAPKGCLLQRYKGLGEMDAEQLKETTMDKKSRTLMQVSIEDAAESERMIKTLMGDNVEIRKAYIFKYADFNKETLFDEIGGK